MSIFAMNVDFLLSQGMEPEIQRLIAKHKAELQSERVKAQDHTR